MDRKLVQGHTSAILIIIIWEMSFVSTKILFENFQPIEILFICAVWGH